MGFLGASCTGSELFGIPCCRGSVGDCCASFFKYSIARRRFVIAIKRLVATQSYVGFARIARSCGVIVKSASDVVHMDFGSGGNISFAFISIPFSFQTSCLCECLQCLSYLLRKWFKTTRHISCHFIR